MGLCSTNVSYRVLWTVVDSYGQLHLAFQVEGCIICAKMGPNKQKIIIKTKAYNVLHYHPEASVQSKSHVSSQRALSDPRLHMCLNTPRQELPSPSAPDSKGTTGVFGWSRLSPLCLTLVWHSSLRLPLGLSFLIDLWEILRIFSARSWLRCSFRQ